MKKKQSESLNSKELIIGKKSRQQLNKQQQIFNRLVKKLEKLRQESVQTAAILGEKLAFYGREIHPLEQNLTALRREIIKLFYSYYINEKLLSKKDRKSLLEIISVQLDGIFEFSREQPDEELKEIFAAVEGISYDQAVAEDFEAIKEDMSETFQEMGFEVDLDDFSKNMSEEEMQAKMAEMLRKLQEQAAAKDSARPKRKKSRKQIEKEEREQQAEEIKNKSISSIYKQLARIFHPDLELDPARKLEKENLMKQLTGAYEKNDLHTLLRLELEWIQKEEDNLDKLSDEKLAIYNQMLKEQVQELEAEIFMIGQHPRYEPLQRFSFSPFGIKHLDLKREKRELKTTIHQAEQSLAELKSENAVGELKKIIAFFNRPKPKFDLFELDIEQFFK